MKTIQKTAVLVGVAALLGLAQVGAQAGDILPPLGGVVKKERPERPDKPPKDSGKTDRPNLTEIRDVVKSFQDDKKKYLDEQKEAVKAAKDDARKDLPGQVGATVRNEVKDSVKAIQEQAREQARKLKEEAKAAADDGHRGKD